MSKLVSRIIIDDVLCIRCAQNIFWRSMSGHSCSNSFFYNVCPPIIILGVVTSGYLATGALSGDEDRPYMVKNVDDGETLPTSAELRSKKRRIGWMIFGTVMLGFILVIGLVVGLQKPSVVVDPIGFMGNETEESVDVVVDVKEPVVETLVDEQLPIDNNMNEEESVEEKGEVDVPLFEDSVISLGSSEDVDSSKDTSSDVSLATVEEAVEDEDEEEEASSPSFNLDTTNAIDNEDEEEDGTASTGTHDHNHAHVGSNDVVSSDDTSEQHDNESNHNPFEPEVAIGMAALLNQISEGNSTTTVSPSSSPTKSPVAVTSEPTKAPTNEVRTVLVMFCAYLMFISCGHISHFIHLSLIILYQPNNSPQILHRQRSPHHHLPLLRR